MRTAEILICTIFTIFLRDWLISAYYIGAMEDELSWPDAKDNCEREHGRLLILDSADKVEPTKDTGKYWIGLSTATSNCEDYRWVNGDALTWTLPWETPHEPNECKSSQCIMMNRFQLRTDDCDIKDASLCEFEWDIPTTTETTPSATTLKIAPASNSTSTIRGYTTITMPTVTPAVTMPANTTIVTPATNRTMTTDTRAVTMPTNTSSVTPATNQTVPSTDTRAVTMPTNTSTVTPASNQTATGNVTCECCTTSRRNVTQFTEDERLAAIAELKAGLSVAKNNTTNFRRNLISVYDSRPSSVVMGCVGGVVLALVFGWIVVPDLGSLAMHLSTCSRKTRVTHKV